MVSTRKIKQRKRRLHGQLDDSIRFFFVRIANFERQKVADTDGQALNEFASDKISGAQPTSENLNNINILEKNGLSDRIAREMGNVSETVEVSIQNDLLAAVIE